MQALFNEPPAIGFAFDYEDHRKTIESGCASTIRSADGQTVLAFKSVEDHVDGNGWVALWLAQGSGVFYLDGRAMEMKTGDAIAFDDNAEHGFEGDELCVGVNFFLGGERTPEEIKELIQRANAPPARIKPRSR